MNLPPNSHRLLTLLVALGMILSFVAMGAGSVAAAPSSQPDASLQSGSIVWQGQQVNLTVPNNVASGDTFELRRYDSSNDRTGSFVREFAVDDDRAYLLDSERLSGEYVIVPAGERGTVVQFDSTGTATGTVDAADADPFEVVVQRLRITWETDDITTSDDEVEVEIDSNRARYNMNVTAEGLDFDDLETMFRSTPDHTDASDPVTDRSPFAGHDTYADDDVLVVRGYGDGTLLADFRHIDPGTYTFKFTVTDTGVSTAATPGEDDDDDDPADPAFFEVSDLELTDESVEPGASVSVSATVTNTGGESTTQTVELLVDDDVVGEEELTLEADDSETVSMNVTAPDEPGSYVVELRTGDDSLTGPLTVEAPDEPTDETEPADDDEATEDESPGFGVLVALFGLIGASLIGLRIHTGAHLK